MNILIIGKPFESLLCAILSSRHLDTIYTATSSPVGDLPNISYNNLNELAQKAKSLQTDIAINTDKTLIDLNITEIFKAQKINLFSVNKKWFNLESARLSAKQLMTHYSINNPKLIKVPLAFPVIIRTTLDTSFDMAVSISELISKIEAKSGQKPYIEEYLNGKNFNLTVLWDGKNFFFFNSPENLTEVQEDRLNLLKTKLHFMFSDEKADFLGIFTICLVWAKNDWYVKDFVMAPDEEVCNIKPESLKHDFLYTLNAAIYQKLNELQ